ncbi:MlaD family protein [Mycobacteroides saopaulense]|uniref:Mammalian cell entry protein n=1 Tax=Mycobacteroides saopaulense TaxID=1578165 RepID=A0ABX3C2Q7_9MYCO|nr:MCE family protein [Mycobacteroides saopaulense]OHT85153.1 mammalian cell entry protein [Mycobacteroides saopaulense]OHU11303.1 mammalian cell entry protein [Mycobacteroides saopaulense]
MPNPFEVDGRGPSDNQLLTLSVVTLAAIVALTGTMLLKSAGRLNDYVPVVADLMNVGDGLPQKSDVKYHGVLVGEVDDVTPATGAKPNFVHINLKPQYVKSIPSTATARVVPSNVFAVSSVQLVDRGPGAPIRAGAHIAEDQELPTVLFQTTVSKLRDVLNATGRGREDNSVGILAAVGAATDSRRVKLLAGGAQLNRLITELNAIVATDTGPSTASALLNAAEGLKQSAPDLLDSLHQAVQPMQTLAEKREQLTTLLHAGLTTVGTNKKAFDNHTDQLIGITTELTPPIGVFAKNADKFVPIFRNINKLSRNWFEQMWMADRDVPNMPISITLAPSYTYTRADCPRYGEVKGPSCFTAPEQVVRPDLPETLLPQNYKVPPDLAPPAGTVIGPNGNLVAVAPPRVVPPGGPNLTDPNPPLPPWQPFPVPRVPGTSDPDDLEPPPPPAVPPIPPAPVAPGGINGPGRPALAPASYGGNVGPVGSRGERDQLRVIAGGSATSATQLLLGPVARGSAVSFVKEGPS